MSEWCLFFGSFGASALRTQVITCGSGASAEILISCPIPEDGHVNITHAPRDFELSIRSEEPGAAKITVRPGPDSPRLGVVELKAWGYDVRIPVSRAEGR